MDKFFYCLRSVFMHKLLLTTMSALLLMGCEVIDDAATEKEQPINSEALSVSIPFSQESVFAEVAHSAAIVVTFNNEVILEQELVFTDSTVQGTVNNLVADRTYDFVLSILDSDGEVVYEGVASAAIASGKASNVDITLYATTGSANINGSIIDNDTIKVVEQTILILASTEGVVDLSQQSELTNDGVETEFVQNGLGREALKIDQSSHIRVGDKFDFGMEDYSISFDIKAPLHDGAILSKYRGGVGAPETGWNIQCENSGGSYRAGVRFDISDGVHGKWGVLSSGPETLDNEWHSILITVNRTDGVATMHVDGEVSDQADISKFGLADNGSDLLIGWRGDSWYHMNGYLDNIKIFSHLVHLDEAATLDGDLLSIAASDGSIVDNSILQPTISNENVTVETNSEVIENGFYFDSTDYISCNNPDLFNIGEGDFTIKFSLKANLQDAPILSKYRGGIGAPENGWNVQIENSGGDIYREGVRFDVSDGEHGKWGLLASGVEALDNEWHNIEIIYHRSQGYASMKVDESVVDSADISSFNSIANSADLLLGWRGDSWFHLNGAIDNVEILNYVQ